MAIARAAALEPLYKQPIPVKQSALVVGAGAAGMTSALTLADHGYPVHLIERQDQIGGSLRESYFRFPGSKGQTPQDLLTELSHRVMEHPQITCHLETEVQRTTGFVGNFRSTIQCNGLKEELEHGVVIVATGGQEHRGPEYGYGSHPSILTQLELENQLAVKASLLPEPASQAIDLDDLQQVVMIQCVGPAEEYCARTCCTTALKNALLLKEVNPSVQIIVLYRDIRTYGFYERLYKDAREQGVLFIRYTEDNRPEISGLDGQDNIRLSLIDPTLGRPITLEPDIVVLSMPVVPSDGNHKLATTLKVPVDQDGWFLEAHVKLRPVEFASDGIFLAGVAHYPKMMDESIVQAQAAASRAATILANPERLAGGAIAEVNIEKCVGCLTCVRVCPFDIPLIKMEMQGVGEVWGAAYIEPSVCQGCGTCVAACPAEAIELLHYRHSQIESQVYSLFEEPSFQAIRKVKSNDN
jgi:heterodisulfide reductase subunit A